MKKSYLLFSLTLLTLFFSEESFSQNLNLNLFSNNEIENIVLQKIDYQLQHKDTSTISLEILKISNYLKSIGYFTNTFDSIRHENENYIAYFSLRKKIQSAKINIVNKLLDSKISEKDSITIPINELELFLYDISKELDSKGKSFSKVQLENITINSDTLFADLLIEVSEERKINKIIIKGYEDFPTSFLKHYFTLKKNTTIFSQQRMKKIANLSKNLQFIDEIKPPEVLFKKDSTFLYLYLKKKQNNSFDGLVNFASEENGDILFNGTIDLQLKNVLNKGEEFTLFWNSIGKERQEFRLTTEIPYLFKSPITPCVSFNIYRQDSTFLNTNLSSKLLYNINTKIRVGITYESETSENLQNTNNTIDSFNRFFLGTEFSYRTTKNNIFLDDRFYLKINPSIGKRNTQESSSSQLKIDAVISYLWDITKRSSFYIKNTIGFISSDDFIDNELFRIGGANSIRGFNEQSIFTSSFSIFNLEYRYLTSEKSYFYSITDIARANITQKNKNLLGAGIGYSFITNNSQINISTAAGNNFSQNFNTKDIKIIISWKTFF